MKYSNKLLLTCIIVMLVFSIASCKKEEPENTPYSCGNINVNYAITDNGLFSIKDELLHFKSEETGEDIIFCFDPACEHEPASAENPDPECPAALFLATRTKIAYHNEYIYYFVDKEAFSFELYRMNINGSAREFIGEIPYGFPNLEYVFYGDYLYCNARIMEEPEVGHALLSYGVLLEINLNTGDYRVLLERDEESNYAVKDVDVSDNTLFAVVPTEGGDSLIKMNLETLEQTVIIEKLNYYGKMYKGIYDSDNYYYCSTNEIGISNSVSGEDTVLITLDENKVFTSLYFSNHGIIYYVNTINRDDIEKTYFYDVSTKETIDITEKLEAIGGIHTYDGYLNKIIWSIKSEPDENGRTSIIGYDVMDMADFLEEN
ncbi:MAG: hypothetical protein IKK96_04880 [Lachnospiraceae bacterium]|nr:hypothetical protein [Lachnospiraceae bacterium]